MLPSCMELMAMLPPSTMVAALTLMVPSTWARGLLMLNQTLMLLFCMELMAMLPPTLDTLATPDTLPTLTPMVANPMLMVPDMAHTPSRDKKFTTPSNQSIHRELKLSVVARGLLMLSQKLMLLFSTELMAMLATPPLTPTDTLPTLLLWWLPIC